MDWLPGFAVAAAVALVWWMTHSRAVREARRLVRTLDEIVAGTTPQPLPENARFGPSLRRVAALAADRQKLRDQSAHEAFNLQTILGSMEEGVMVVDAQHV